MVKLLKLKTVKIKQKFKGWYVGIEESVDTTLNVGMSGVPLRPPPPTSLWY